MTVRDAIEALSKLDPNVHLCGNANDESLCLFSGISDLRVADEWHDSLPKHAPYFIMRFEEQIKRRPANPEQS